jgi:putative transcriptional regulator
MRPPLPEAIDVRQIRRRMNISRRDFAAVFRVPVATLRHWENGERRPRGTARILLLVIARNPHAVIQALKNWEFRSQHGYPAGSAPITKRSVDQAGRRRVTSRGTMTSTVSSR